MTRFLAIGLSLALIASPAAASIVFSYEQVGSTTANNCPAPLPAQPLCSIIDASGTANDVPDAIAGDWLVTLQGQVLFFEGAGSFMFDDMSAANNDLVGTWTNVLLPPDASGIAHSIFEWTVTSGSGIFAGLTGFGRSEGDVVILPAGLDAQGTPIFVAACARAQPGLGSYCDAGRFVIAEPATLGLLVVGLAAAALRRRRVLGASG